jgi:hypothetical protein
MRSAIECHCITKTSHRLFEIIVNHTNRKLTKIPLFDFWNINIFHSYLQAQTTYLETISNFQENHREFSKLIWSFNKFSRKKQLFKHWPIPPDARLIEQSGKWYILRQHEHLMLLYDNIQNIAFSWVDCPYEHMHSFKMSVFWIFALKERAIPSEPKKMEENEKNI